MGIREGLVSPSATRVWGITKLSEPDGSNLLSTDGEIEAEVGTDLRSLTTLGQDQGSLSPCGPLPDLKGPIEKVAQCPITRPHH